MEKIWNCVECGWTTTDNTVRNCQLCTGSLLIVPQNMDNDLFLAIDYLLTYYYKLGSILNNLETGVELYSNYEKIATIRNWEDFKEFFGNYFYRQFKKESE